MTIKDILENRGRGVITIDERAPVSAAVGAMRREGLTALAVSPDGRRLAGLISEYDVMRAMQGGDSERVLAMPVADLMSRRVTLCRPEESLRRVMTRMSAQRTRHAAVMAGERLCGIASMAEIVEFRLREAERQIPGGRDLRVAAV